MSCSRGGAVGEHEKENTISRERDGSNHILRERKFQESMERGSNEGQAVGRPLWPCSCGMRIRCRVEEAVDLSGQLGSHQDTAASSLSDGDTPFSFPAPVVAK